MLSNIYHPNYTIRLTVNVSSPKSFARKLFVDFIIRACVVCLCVCVQTLVKSRSISLIFVPMSYLSPLNQQKRQSCAYDNFVFPKNIFYHYLPKRNALSVCYFFLGGEDWRLTWLGSCFKLIYSKTRHVCHNSSTSVPILNASLPEIRLCLGRRFECLKLWGAVMNVFERRASHKFFDMVAKYFGTQFVRKSLVSQVGYFRRWINKSFAY